MPSELATLLKKTIDREQPLLEAVHEEGASQTGFTGVSSTKPSWTKKQELGHLIDSATNNHVRFVRAVVMGEFRDHGYAQDAWVELHGYGDLEWSKLVSLWYQTNWLLTELIARIPFKSLDAPCISGLNSPLTLGFVIEDYVLHMQHHLDHILERETVTIYPRPD